MKIKLHTGFIDLGSAGFCSQNMTVASCLWCAGDFAQHVGMFLTLDEDSVIFSSLHFHIFSLSFMMELFASDFNWKRESNVLLIAFGLSNVDSLPPK